jgi:hypothetical protein
MRQYEHFILTGKYLVRCIDLVLEGCWLYLSYKGLWIWFSVFTPKGAEYIEDVPMLRDKLLAIHLFVLENLDMYYKYTAFKAKIGWK